MNDGVQVKWFRDNGNLRLFWPVMTMVYWLATSLLHLEISKIIVSPVSTPLGAFTPAHYSCHLAWGLLILGALFVLLMAVKGETRLRTAVYWIMWGAAVYGANRLLVFSPNEYVHYPQYALLAVLLVIWRDPHLEKWPIGNLIFWGTALGIADELMQYFFICPTYGDYLDFNDFLLNELGIVAGLLLVYGFREQSAKIEPLSPIHKTRAFKTIIIGFIMVSVLIFTDRLRITPPEKVPPGGIFAVNGKRTIYIERKPGITGTWNRFSDGRAYYVLSPAAGLSLLFALGFLFASLDPRILKRIGCRGRTVCPS
ncbi:MAG: hypothetical protein GY846_10590 [Deltaproteobacteria bacterium]|nr:hypothetical protein [Deltaproteobacteria bacterium]